MQGHTQFREVNFYDTQLNSDNARALKSSLLNWKNQAQAKGTQFREVNFYDTQLNSDNVRALKSLLFLDRKNQAPTRMTERNKRDQK